MPRSAAEVLEKLNGLGFRFLTLPRYEKQVAAERGGFVALLEYTAAGEIHQFSSAGLLMEGHIAMLVERGAVSFFVAKQHEQPATPELFERYRQFQRDLETALG